MTGLPFPFLPAVKWLSLELEQTSCDNEEMNTRKKTKTLGIMEQKKKKNTQKDLKDLRSCQINHGIPPLEKKTLIFQATIRVLCHLH